MAFNPHAKNSLVVTGADFFFTVINNPLSKKYRDVIWFCRKDCRRGARSSCCLNMISITLNLLNRSCIAKAEAFSRRIILFCKNIQNFMEVFRIDAVGEFLDCFHIRDFKESSVVYAVTDIPFCSL